MGKNEFLEVLKQNYFYNIIYRQIYRWSVKNKEILLENNRRGLNSIININNIDINYKSVYFNDGIFYKKTCSFSLLVEVYISFEGTKEKNDYLDYDTYKNWLKIDCIASLFNQMKDFKVIDIDIYDSNYKKNTPLTDNGLLYLNKEDYDLYAEKLLKKYYYKTEKEKTHNCIDIKKIAERMGLSIISTSLSQTKDVFGKFFFEDSKVAVFNSEKEKYEEINVSKNTILLDLEAINSTSYLTKNITIAHECVHALYHYPAYLYMKLINNNFSYISCLVDSLQDNRKDLIEWMEIQANALAPHILMPKERFKISANNLFTKYKIDHNSDLFMVEKIILSLAKEYKVTIYSVRKRLLEIGYDIAYGVFNYIGKDKLRPFCLSDKYKGDFDSSETYSISLKNAIDLFSNDYKFAFLLLKKEYVFVENHFCINDEKYLIVREDGKLELSRYALHNIDECCIKFKVVKKTKEYKLTKEFVSLFRDNYKELDFDLKMASEPNIYKTKDYLEKWKVHDENVRLIIKEIEDKNYVEILNYLVKFLKISVKKLTYDTGLSTKTIERYLLGENKNPNKRTLVSIVRALNVPSRISEIIFRQAGIAFIKGNKEDDALLFVLNNCRLHNYKDVNRLLMGLGFSPLSKKK